MRFALDDQIASQPDTVARIIDRDVPGLDARRPIVFKGVGTSLHAARVATAWVWLVSDGRVHASAVDAHDLALCYPLAADDQVVVISHRGHKRYPRAVLDKARSARATAIAVVGAQAPEQNADVVVRTCPNETAGTFTVSYLSSLAALAGLVAGVGGPHRERFRTALSTVPESLRRTLAIPAPVEVSQACARSEPLSCWSVSISTPSPPRRPPSRSRRAPVCGRRRCPRSSPCTAHRRCSVPGWMSSPSRRALTTQGRTATLRALLAELGARVWTCGQTDEQLRFASTDPWMRPFTSIVPMQRLTAGLARLRHTDPDNLHGGVEPWRSAMTRLEL
jgi:glucosamine--fructose-6-phosphate aminotransferase (isomerizing)